jgi:2-polyprenyl-6-hydroxyphenyl methylase/3-demethylubiquinone-9 3-methyltransferase
VAAGQRFQFGDNWARFLTELTEARIQTAERSLMEYLGTTSLAGKRFVDVGSGSGLFSLAARRLGASVHSLDYDPQSVACTRELRRRFFPDDPQWVVEEASVLDAAHMAGLQPADVLYSWGVLHHTGAMWDALANVAPVVKPGGQLFVAIYNDQGTPSKRWLAVKKAYCQLPPSLRFLVLWPSAVHLWWQPMLKDFLLGRPFRTWREYRKKRGMSAWRDIVDWVGGYPFEVAKPEEIFEFYKLRGFQLEKLKTEHGGSVGCNEFVFRRV